MNSELLLTGIKVFNVILCLCFIAITIWHNTIQKIHSNLVQVLISILFLFLISQIAFPSSFDLIGTTLSLLILIVIAIKHYKLSTAKSNQESSHSDDLINHAKEQERSRIYANIHDDVGAKLLELIYAAPDEKSKALAKQVLTDIRQAVANTVNVHCNVNQLSYEIIEETEMRLNSASIKFSKKIKLINPNKSLAPNIPIALSRICREITSNIIKHSQATHVSTSIKSSDNKLQISILDNGIGISDENKTGKGLNTINKRAQSISSVISWDSNSLQGTQFTLTYHYDNH